MLTKDNEKQIQPVSPVGGEEQAKLSALRASIRSIETHEPSPLVWQTIAQKVETNTPTSTQLRPRYIGLAAALLVALPGVLLWQNHALQSDLEQVLTSNQLLEEQLMLNHVPMMKKVNLLSELRLLDEQLYHAESQREKLIILNQRKHIIEKSLNEHTKEPRNVFSI